MRPTLAAHASRQNGLVTRSQALASGYADCEIRHHAREKGPWVVVRRGVYMERERWEAADDRQGKRLLRALAAHLSMTREHVVSHTSAGLLHELAMLHPGNDLVHVTRPGVTGSRTRHGVKHHLAGFSPTQISSIAGVPALDLARTAVDIGRELGHQHGLVACDAARQRGVTYEDLAAAVEPMEHWPHVTRARSAVEDSDPGAESVGETLARELVAGLGLGPVQTQFSVVEHGRLHFADLRVGRHLIEFDGRVKYQRREEGGVADRPAGDVLWAEKQREGLICAEGYGMTRLIWADLWGSSRERAAERIGRDHALTTARFGSELPRGYQPVPRRRQLGTAS